MNSEFSENLATIQILSQLSSLCPKYEIVAQNVINVAFMAF